MGSRRVGWGRRRICIDDRSSDDGGWRVGKRGREEEEGWCLAGAFVFLHIFRGIDSPLLLLLLLLPLLDWKVGKAGSLGPDAR